MLAYSCFAVCLFPVIALGETSKHVFIRKAGFPVDRVNQRAACAERPVRKTVLNPDFLFPILLGFREGHCSSIGYDKVEGNRTAAEFPGLQWLPLLHRNVTYQMYSRDPTFMDVADCISSECSDHLSALRREVTARTLHIASVQQWDLASQRCGPVWETRSAEQPCSVDRR